MINPRKKSKYWVDDNSILPEIIITPQGNYPILDEAGNPARTVGAIQDINPNAHIYERVNTQPFMDDYIEGETNTAANQRADALDAQVVPHMGDFVSAATKPLDVLMPSRWVGLLDKDYNGLSVGDRLTRLFDENNKGLFINDNPYGLFSKRYAKEHPYWTMAGNAAFDIASTPFIWNGANRAYNTGKTAYNAGRNAVRNYNFAKALDADIVNTNLAVGEPIFKGNTRIKIGDVELNNPQLAYRQVDAAAGADFLDTGIADAKGSFKAPLFNQGKTFYSTPLEDPSLLYPRSDKSRFILIKQKDLSPKSDLLVSNGQMVPADMHANVKSWTYKIMSEDGNNVLGESVTPELRRVPAGKGVVNSSNTNLYRWEPGYGYRKITSEPSNTYYIGNNLVDAEGNLTKPVEDIVNEVRQKYPYIQNPTELINKGYKGSTDLIGHIKAVVKSAKEYPLPEGVTRQEFVTAALYHDLGKLFGSYGHGVNSNTIVNTMHWPLTENIATAVARHMEGQPYFENASNLSKALHTADVGRGRPYNELVSEYPYLEYPIQDMVPRITEENAATMTPKQWTAAQDAAIAKGDMVEAQRLRDLHFKVSAPNTQIVDKNGNPIHSYHGTGKRFNEFDTTGKYSTLDEGYYGKGAYFAPNKEIAQMYADTEKTPIIYDTYLNIKNPLRHIRDENADLYGKIITNNDGVISTLPEDLVDETFDMTEYVATNPNQIKSADAVTYNGNGIRIPLGDRDNFSNPDIRYGFIPWFLGAGAGTAYGILNQGNNQ